MIVIAYPSQLRPVTVAARVKIRRGTPVNLCRLSAYKVHLHAIPMDTLTLRELAYGGVAEENGRVDSSNQRDAKAAMNIDQSDAVLKSQIAGGCVSWIC